MSKADLLGGSATFDAVAQPLSSRAASFAAFAGHATDSVPETESDTTPRTPRIGVDQLAHNPYNPREELKAIEEMADSLTGRGIIQPLTVVTRKAFLEAHPSHEVALGSADYVVVDGNRRLAGARLAGLDEVPVHVDDSLAESADTLLESALTAAVQHENLEPLDEAKALQRLVSVHGSQRAVARALGKSSPWVTQRLALLKLTPELQQAVEEKSLPVEVARRVGQLPHQQQHQAAEQALTDRADSKKRKRQPSQGANAVSTQMSPQTASDQQPVDTSAVAAADPSRRDNPDAPDNVPSRRVKQDASPSSPEVVPARILVAIPWHDGDEVADLVIQKMSADQRDRLLQRLLAARDLPPTATNA